MKKFDAIVPLGGGRNKDGSLTEMSSERLDKAVELYLEGVAPVVFAIGGYKSTYRPNAIEFDQTGGELMVSYLVSKGVPAEKIITLTQGCQDTIGEALAVRESIKQTPWRKLLVVTSQFHLPRALFVFNRILGEEYDINGASVPSDGILIEAEEKEYLSLIKDYFLSLPQTIKEKNFDQWFNNHADYYAQLVEIHDRYHSNGRESQAYLAVKD